MMCAHSTHVTCAMHTRFAHEHKPCYAYCICIVLYYSRLVCLCPYTMHIMHMRVRLPMSSWFESEVREGVGEEGDGEGLGITQPNPTSTQSLCV